MKRQTRRKLYPLVSMFFVIVLLAGVGTLAWFTLSTNPEIGGISMSLKAEGYVQIAPATESTNFVSSLNLADYFSESKDPITLVPASTVNGEDWFVVNYASNGDVVSTNAEGTYSYLHFPDGGFAGQAAGTKAAVESANSASAHNVSGLESLKYYAYTDIYMRNVGSDCDVYLAVPSTVTPDSPEDYHYGTFVKSFVNTTGSFKLVEGGPETSARVGFRTLGALSGSTPSSYSEDIAGEALYKVDDIDESRLVIYEPNADCRSLGTKYSNADDYVVGFELSEYVSPNDTSQGYAALSGNYIPTYPVSLNGARETANDGTEIMVDPNNLIVQKNSSWNHSGTETTSPDSRDVAMGKFLSAATLYSGKTYSGSNTLSQNYWKTDTSGMEGSVSSQLDGTGGVRITHLEDGNPVRIRIYFWIEGQDIDCWNDIRDISFLVNLEFVAVAE